jgi:hypothetical protein
MSAPTSFWLETRQTIAQWTGIVMASALSGVLLGVLRRQGVVYRPALEIALPVGFLLALLFWIWLSRQFSIKAIQIPVPISPNVTNFEGQLTTVVSFQMIEQPTIASQARAA